MPPAGITTREARLALALLFGVNFLNYIDRYVAAAVLLPIQREFGLDDTRAGLVLSMFMVAYMVASPFAGVLADRFPRRYFVGGGVLVWSLATVASGLSSTYHHLLGARSFIGVGEAGFGGVAPTLISDYFPKHQRGRMLSFFYVAIPVGSAIGYLLGGWVGGSYGWRHAFFLAGAPGLLLGLLAFRIKEPARGAGDGVVQAEHRFEAAAITGLVRNRSFLLTTLGMAAMTFALGGLASWMPTFFARERGMPLAEANSMFGAVTVAAGLIGTFVGGWLGDRLLQRTRAAYLLVSGAGMLLALPATWLALTLTDRALSMGFIFVAEVLVFLNTGPANAVLVNVALPEIRATAIAVSIFVFHLLGDVPSPILIGWVSDRSGLQTALLGLSLLAMAASGVLYLWGSRSVAEDSERVERAVRERESEHARADQDTA